MSWIDDVSGVGLAVCCSCCLDVSSEASFDESVSVIVLVALVETFGAVNVDVGGDGGGVMSVLDGGTPNNAFLRADFSLERMAILVSKFQSYFFNDLSSLIQNDKLLHFQ